MAGRKPTPTAIRELRGNPGKRALPANEPVAEPSMPLYPSYFTDDQRDAWNDLAERLFGMKVLTEGDAMALELLVVAYTEWRYAVATVEEEGSTYCTTTESGDRMYRARPEVAIASDAWRRISSMLREFGLTPSARTKVSVADGAQPQNAFMALMG
jgi:P27 family predicted phage terminase small subunit